MLSRPGVNGELYFKCKFDTACEIMTAEFLNVRFGKINLLVYVECT
jgi:hypothetical protein